MEKPPKIVRLPKGKKPSRESLLMEEVKELRERQDILEDLFLRMLKLLNQADNLNETS